jgi:2,3-bisphosphoglycerate-independent phosphoglycerate mutase
MKQALLIILDGFGLRTNSDFNAVKQAQTPNLNHYIQHYAFAPLNASEQFVGLPAGQFGNSEVGHLNLGAGRVVRQDISRIDYAIETGEFTTNEAFTQAFSACKSGTLHILGLLSDGGVHAQIAHIEHLIKLAAAQPKITQIWVHPFLDGRDTPPQSALKYLDQLARFLTNYPQAKIATLGGRYFAMDRDQRWERVELAFNALVYGQGKLAPSAEQAVRDEYAQGVNDEFIPPYVLNSYQGIAAGDSVIFANFRADRGIQLTDALVNPEFTGFKRGLPPLAAMVTMTRYSDKFSTLVAFKPETISNTLGEYISQLGLKQLRIAETEKYPHVTYFFNGGCRAPFKDEERVLVDSPKDVATYDLKPEMSLPKLAQELVAAIQRQEYSLLIANFANGDMVGHTGNYTASIQAVEALDKYVGEVVTAMQQVRGEVLIVADHGNCEEMFDYTANQPHTQHTSNLVPCIYIGRPAKLSEGGALKDVAPSLLAMLDLPKPLEMTGSSLINFVS